MTPLLDAPKLSLAAAARKLGVHLSTVHRWRFQGLRGRKLRTIRIGCKCYVAVADLEAWVQFMSDPPTERKASDDFTEHAWVANERAVARIVVFMNLARWVADLYLHLGGNDVHYLDCGIFLLSVVGGCLFIVLRERKTLGTWRRPPCP